jgi:hypothetical protein
MRRLPRGHSTTAGPADRHLPGALLFLFMVFLSMIMVYNLNRLVERLQRYLYSG